MSALLFCACVLSIAATASGIKLQDHHRLSHHKYYLGRHRSLHGYAFVHYHEKHSEWARNYTARPVHSLSKRQVSACSAPIAEGAKWRTSKGYVVHTRNEQGLSAEYILTSMSRAMDRWQCVMDSLGIYAIGPRVGVERNVPASEFVIDRPTGRNEIGFGPIEGRPGTVAVTVVWGVFGGPVQTREIREFKMRFDEEHYRFGNASLSGQFMDLEGIATHEVGHAYGLDDIYVSQCDHVTMFGTSRTGEQKKRTLSFQDVDGIRELYD